MHFIEFFMMANDLISEKNAVTRGFIGSHTKVLAEEIRIYYFLIRNSAWFNTMHNSRSRPALPANSTFLRRCRYRLSFSRKCSARICNQMTISQCQSRQCHGGQSNLFAQDSAQQASRQETANIHPQFFKTQPAFSVFEF